MDSIDENIYVSSTSGFIATPTFLHPAPSSSPSLTESISNSVSNATSSLSSSIDHSATRLSDSMHDIRDSTSHRFNDLRDTTSHKLNDIRDTTNHKLNDIRDTTNQKLSGVSATLQNAKETVKTTLNDGLKTVKTEVKHTEEIVSDKLHHAGDVVKAHLPGSTVRKESQAEPLSYESTKYEEATYVAPAKTESHPDHLPLELSQIDASRAPAYTIGEKLQHIKDDIVQGVDHLVHPSHPMHPPHIVNSNTGTVHSIHSSKTIDSSKKIDTNNAYAAAAPSHEMELHADDSKWQNKSAEIPIASYPPQPDAAPNADPTLEYSLPATPSKSSEHGLLDNIKEDYRSVKDKLHDLSDKITTPLHEATSSILHPSGAANTQSRAEHLTTVHSTKREVEPLSHEHSTSKTDKSTGGSWGFTKEASMRDNELSEKEKEEHDKFPTKMDRKGDIESFKKVVHSGHERSIGINAVRDDRHYDKSKE